MTVDRLWMHRPWNYGNLAPLFKDDRVTDASVREALRRDLNIAKAIEKAALKTGVVIEEPFANTSCDELVYVIGPTMQFYAEQIAHFFCTPAPVSPIRKPLTLASLLGGPAKQENWLNETLDCDCDTSAENNTSVILAVKLRDSYWAMFTGDAGEPALLGALDWLDYTNFSTSNFKFVQIPHHGSEHNISPAVLHRWLGSPQLFDRKSRTAYVSSALKAPKHLIEQQAREKSRHAAIPIGEGVDAQEVEYLRWNQKQRLDRAGIDGRAEGPGRATTNGDRARPSLISFQAAFSPTVWVMPSRCPRTSKGESMVRNAVEKLLT